MYYTKGLFPLLLRVALRGER